MSLSLSLSHSLSIVLQHILPLQRIANDPVTFPRTSFVRAATGDTLLHIYCSSTHTSLFIFRILFFVSCDSANVLALRIFLLAHFLSTSIINTQYFFLFTSSLIIVLHLLHIEYLSGFLILPLFADDNWPCVHCFRSAVQLFPEFVQQKNRLGDTPLHTLAKSVRYPRARTEILLQAGKE